MAQNITPDVSAKFRTGRSGKTHCKVRFQPYLIAVNLTRRCNLKCAHCYLDAGGKNEAAAGELSTAELTSIFAEIAERAEGTLIVLTGGEPLLRPDIGELVSAGNALGLRMVLGTNGLGLSAKTVRELKASGLQGVGISLDNLHPEAHDEFRGVPGAWEKTVAAIRACRDCGLHVQIHTTITRQNADQIDDFVELAKNEGAAILNFFFLVCTGRGQWMSDISPERYENVLGRIAELQRNTKSLMIQARCAPHFKRILYQQDPQSPFTRAQGYDGGGCPAATHYCRIDPLGNVTPCPYMGSEPYREPYSEPYSEPRNIVHNSTASPFKSSPNSEPYSEPRNIVHNSTASPLPAATNAAQAGFKSSPNSEPYSEPYNVAGNVRESGFWKIWDESPLFEKFRSPVLKGRCGSCEFRNLCGGCRARAQAGTSGAKHFGDLTAEDPTCTWQPKNETPVAIDLPSGNLDGSVEWTPEAKKRLKRIPIFLRGMIRKRLEEKARQQDIIITPEFMAEHRKQREQELGIQFE